mmetsp:Transcript_41675/g.129909  ORF Transcript_41675/g.129909 Transcript_41675/m.129909 type:complete len:230 (+) Transcript_41675:837-1526(+)
MRHHSEERGPRAVEACGGVSGEDPEMAVDVVQQHVDAQDLVDLEAVLAREELAQQGAPEEAMPVLVGSCLLRALHTADPQALKEAVGVLAVPRLLERLRGVAAVEVALEDPAAARVLAQVALDVVDVASDHDPVLVSGEFLGGDHAVHHRQRRLLGTALTPRDLRQGPRLAARMLQPESGASEPLCQESPRRRGRREGWRRLQHCQQTRSCEEPTGRNGGPDHDAGHMP